MTIQEAKDNLGQPFKIISFTGLLGRFDTIRSVDPDGTIHGDFLEAHCLNCRFKEEQPDQLKKKIVCSCGNPECGNPIVLCT